MTSKDASIIIGNIPIEGDDCYTIAEYQEAKAMAIKALDQRWIPVSERLPEDKQGCIVTVQGDSKTFIDIVTYYAEEHSFLYYEECNVLAWMPLPEPYKEDTEC